MNIYKKSTLNDEGEFIDIYECGTCKKRSRFAQVIHDCEIKHEIIVEEVCEYCGKEECECDPDAEYDMERERRAGL